ncbi:serine hydrolase domain-containing protein [Epilithonimonas sp.]|uniref:serine hydrolase domain-containing protein n=1 Tax=Epilithonimonas sp. TaxID=2894511 RepID=UPI002FDE8F10
MFRKVINIVLLIIAGAILLIYITDYNYLFRGIKLTYLRGESSSTINDGKYFPSNTISKGIAKPWKTDINYNRKSLSKELQDHLEKTKSVSFLVIKNGKILQEKYWDSYNKTTASNSFSMAKTVTVLLLGKAIDDGRIINSNQKFSDFYPDFSKKEFGNNLTLENLASMEAGLDWKEDYKNPFLPNAAAYYGFSLADVVFNKKLITMPGEKFEYQSGATQLLGFAVGRSVGIPLASYASSKLWKPLGMEQNAEWSTDDLGIEKSFCCIQSNARDFAKLGSLLLNRGKFENIPLINESFVNKMINPSEHSNGVYGMGIWINNDSKIHHYYMHGLYGQYVIMIPEYDMIVVRLGNEEAPEKDSKNRPKEVEFYVNEALKFAEKN